MKDKSAQLNHLRETLASAGMAMPETRAGYAELIKKVDLTTPVGQKMYGVMIGSMGVANEYYLKLENIEERAFLDDGIKIPWEQEWKLKEEFSIEDVTNIVFCRDPEMRDQNKSKEWEGFYNILARAVQDDFDAYNKVREYLEQKRTILRVQVQSPLVPAGRHISSDIENQSVEEIAREMASLMKEAGQKAQKLGRDAQEISIETEQQAEMIGELAFMPETVNGYLLENGEYADLGDDEIRIDVRAIKKWLCTTSYHSSFFLSEEEEVADVETKIKNMEEVESLQHKEVSSSEPIESNTSVSMDKNNKPKWQDLLVNPPERFSDSFERVKNAVIEHIEEKNELPSFEQIWERVEKFGLTRRNVLQSYRDRWTEKTHEAQK